MKKLLLSLVCICVTSFYAGVSAAAEGNLEASQIQIKNPEVKIVAMDKKSAAVAMELDNNSNQTVKLIAAATPVSAETQLHKTVDGKMVQVKEIDIPAHQDAMLGPKRFHIMLIGIETPLKAAQAVPITLIFSDGSNLVINAVVK